MRMLRLMPLLAGLVLAACSAEKAPNLLGGGYIDLADTQGKVLMINYWAEWCSPCRKEIPELNHFAAQHADKVVVLGVNFDLVTGEELQRQVDALGIRFPVLLEDPRGRWNSTASGVLPETLIIDAQGRLVEVLVGPQTLQTLRPYIE